MINPLKLSFLVNDDEIDEEWFLLFDEEEISYRKNKEKDLDIWEEFDYEYIIYKHLNVSRLMK